MTSIWESEKVCVCCITEFSCSRLQTHVQWLISFSLDGVETENKEVTLSARVFGEDVKKLLCITPVFFMISVNCWLYGQYLSFTMITHCVHRPDSIYTPTGDRYLSWSFCSQHVVVV